MRKQFVKIICIVLFFQIICVAEEKIWKDEEYVIKLEDALLISVWKHPDLERRVIVDSKGNISFPLIGEIEAEGLTIRELKDKITYLLEEDYIINPLVTVNIEKHIEKQIFFIYGEVKSPGAHTLEGKLTLLRAITLAGGLSDFASSTVYIKRKVKDKEQRIKVNINKIIKQETPDIPLKADDIIIVPRRFF